MPYATLQLGQAVPWFAARSPVNPDFHFDTVGGRFIVMCFFESAGDPAMRKLLDGLTQNRAAFDDLNVCFFGVSTDSQDEKSARFSEQLPGIHLFWDFDRKISRLYGAAPLEAAENQGGTPKAEGGNGAGATAGDGTAPAAASGEPYRRMTVVLDPRMRVMAVMAIDQNIDGHLARLMDLIRGLPRIDSLPADECHAPVLIVPRIFEPALCQMLIKYYEDRGGMDSGFMREIDGKTVPVYDYGHKRRRDQEIEDENLRNACMYRIHDRLLPEIQKAFAFKATRIERYIVACYEAETGGHFKPHRDNRTRGTAHRRFAVSLVLNSGQFEGGQVRFPEYGPRAYAPPAGGAVVFSCSLLHEAMPVTRGKRYVFLPFLYDDAAAQIREANRQFIVSNPAKAAAGK